MDLEVYGGLTMAHIITTSLRIILAVIPEWHRVQVIPIKEITFYTIGDLTADTVVKTNNRAILNFLFRNSTL